MENILLDFSFMTGNRTFDKKTTYHTFSLEFYFYLKLKRP